MAENGQTVRVRASRTVGAFDDAEVRQGRSVPLALEVAKP
jgi:hypothetical protein